jgi:putative sigma-54 modulation protein
MNIIITARHFKAHESLKDKIKDKIEKLKTYYDGIISCDVVLFQEKDDEIAEVKMRLDHDTIVLTERSDNYYKSIELIYDRLLTKLRRIKGKRNHFEHTKIVNEIEREELATEEEGDF